MDVRIVVEDEVARELLPDLKDWLARIRSEIASHLRAIDRGDDLAFMGTCFLTKQLDHAEALYQLVPRKDTILIARTMVEGLVQFLWAAKDEARAHLWRAHAVIEDFYRIPQMERRHQPPTAEMMAELEEVLESVGPLFLTRKAVRAHAEGGELPEHPYHRSWRGDVSLRDIFEDVEGGDLRRFFYGPYSAWAHWSAGAFGDRLSETDAAVTWSPIAEAYSGEALVFAIMCVLQTAGILFQHIGHEAVEVPGRLRDEFAEWHDQRLEELRREKRIRKTSED